MNSWSTPALIEGSWCNLQRIGLGGDVPDFADHFESEADSAAFEAVDAGQFVLPVFSGGRWVLGEAEIERAAAVVEICGAVESLTPTWVPRDTPQGFVAEDNSA